MKHLRNRHVPARRHHRPYARTGIRHRSTTPGGLVYNTRISNSVASWAVFLALALGSALQAGAQRYLGSIQGEVTDPSGARVSGASVTAEEVATHFKTQDTSNQSGTYNFPSLNPGTYTITINSAGFRAETITNVVLTAGQLQNVDFKLTVGTATESVEVVADNSLIDTGSANIATTLSTQEVTDLPNLGRNPFVQANLGAGVIDAGAYFTGKASGFTNPFSGVAVQITTDGSSGHNRLTIDGIPDDPAERFSGASYTGFVPSPEAVQEVKVQTSIFDAQVGHGNGTTTNTVVRGGTNTVHGAAYYVFQDTYLNANTSEKAPTQNLCYPGTSGCTNTTTPTRRNNDQLSQTGLVFDGPVYIPKIYDGRDKTFFMVSFERFASHQAINFTTRVPTAAELAGDFSGLCSAFNSAGLCTSGIQLYVPNSPLDVNGNRTQYFANNNIAGSISPVGAALLSYLPAANVPGASATTNPNYVSTQTSYPSTYPSFIFRIDQAIHQNDKLNAIFFRSGLTQNYPLQGFPKGIGPTGYGYNVYRNNRGGSLDEVHTFSPSMVLDSRFGLIYHPFGLVYPGASGVNLSTLGISSTGLPYVSFPGTTESDGYAGLASGAGGQVSENTTGSLEEILSKTIGHHSIRIGFEGNLIRYNVQQPASGFGTFGFDRHFTQQNYTNGTAASGDSIADELLGDFSSVSYNISASYALQQIYMAPFVQDDWRITPKLTLNLGLRYDYESPFTERYNKQASNFCTTCTNPLQASVTGLTLNGGLQYTSSSNRYPYPRDLNNIQPRLGAAYQVAPTTVVRAGFGVIYFNTLETPIGTGYSQTTSYNNYAGTTANIAPLNSIANPFPSGVTPATGNSLGLSTALGQSVTFVDPHHVQPKSVQQSVSIQQQFPGDVALQIAYVGARPTRLEVNHNINILPAQYYNQGGAEVNFLNASVNNPMAGLFGSSSPTLNATKIAQNLLLLPYPEFGSVTEDYSSIGSSPYNALQIQVSKPMHHHYSLQGNFTWDKVMVHTAYIDNYAAALGKLESVQDSAPTMFGNIFGLFELPKFQSGPALERLTLGGWQVNTVMRFANGLLISAPSNVDIIGNYYQPNANFFRTFNPCYLQSNLNTTTGAVTYTPVNSSADTTNTYSKVTACDGQSPNPAFRQRIAYTSQSNSNVLNLRYSVHPQADISVFKKFIVREGVSFEIRGEFFNVLNTPNFSGPNTTLGAANTASRAGSGSLSVPAGQAAQINDPRIGQLTARLNF
jgi:hypothetical protein